MQICTLSKREKGLLILLLVVLIAVGGYYYLYRPLVEELECLQAAVADQEDRLARRRELLGQGEGGGAEWRRIDESYQYSLTLLPVDKSMPALIILLEEALAGRDINLQLLQWMEEEREGDLFVYSLQLKVRGGYEGIVDFLESLQDFPRFVRSRAVNLFLDDIDGPVQAELLLQVFSTPDFEEGD